MKKILADCECVAENLALHKAALQISTYISPARVAVDGLTVGGGVSCTGNDLGQPWWAVDLLQEYHLSHVVVTAPDFGTEYRKYHQSCFFEKISHILNINQAVGNSRLRSSYTGYESVPIQSAQCWFPGLVISNAKI